MLSDSDHMRGTEIALKDHLSLTHGGTHNQNSPLLLVIDNWLNALEVKIVGEYSLQTEPKLDYLDFHFQDLS